MPNQALATLEAANRVDLSWEAAANEVDFYASAGWGYTTATRDALLAAGDGNGTLDMSIISDQFGYDSLFTVQIWNDGGTLKWQWFSDYLGGTFGYITTAHVEPDVFHLIEMHTEAGVGLSIRIDGDDYGVVKADAGTPNGIRLQYGQWGGLTDGEYYVEDVKVGTTAYGSTDLFASTFAASFTGWSTSSAIAPSTLTAETDLFPPAPPPTPTDDRFYNTPEWRFAISDLDMFVLTLLDRLATNRSVAVTLNAPRIAEGSVLSANSKVNILHTDGYPYLDEGDRFLFGFRRDGVAPNDPWTIRFSGIIDLIDTQGAGDNASTRYVARDPRQMMFKRPVRDAAGALPSADGLTFVGQTARDILIDLLDATETYDGPHYIDTTGPNLNDTDVIPTITFQQGTTVGEAWGELEATGTMDTVLTPLFDVFATPVKIVQLETYPQVGVLSPDVIMAWDKPGRTLVGISNMRDGSGRENSVRYHYGQGGPASATVDDAGSQVRFGTYFGERFFPGQVKDATTALMAEKALLAYSQGKRTIVATPAPERGKQPFVDYLPGDRVPVSASKALLEDIDTQQRILSIPINIDDNGIETVTGILFTDEGWVGS